MKTFYSAMGILLTAWALVGAPRGYALEAPQAASDHLALAASYEAKAADQGALIAEHTKMKADYKEQFFVNEKLTPMNQIQKMDDHCNNIIQAAQAEKDQLLEFAKWHRMRAAELEGK